MRYPCIVSNCNYVARKEFNLHAHLLGEHQIYKQSCQTQTAVQQHKSRVLILQDISITIKRLKHITEIHSNFYRDKVPNYYSQLHTLTCLIDSADTHQIPEIARIHQSTIDNLRRANLIDAAILLSQCVTVINNDGRGYRTSRKTTTQKPRHTDHNMRLMPKPSHNVPEMQGMQEKPMHTGPKQ